MSTASHLCVSQPLTPLQSNAPGLQYKVMWRQQDVETEWTSVTVANVAKFVVSGTATFVPYEVKVQALNDFGHGPKPAVVIGYSGEDCKSRLKRPFGLNEIDVRKANSQNAFVQFLQQPRITSRLTW